MSKVAIQGNASGTGTFTLEAPNSNTDRTLTLPDSAGTIATTNGITEADLWRLTADVTSNGDITANLEQSNDTGWGVVGTGMAESSGVFTFPRTGIWLVMATFAYTSASGDFTNGQIYVSTDGGSAYGSHSVAVSGGATGANESTSTTTALLDVTNVSNVKVKFVLASISGSTLQGRTDDNRTYFTFIRLGDT